METSLGGRGGGGGDDGGTESRLLRRRAGGGGGGGLGLCCWGGWAERGRVVLLSIARPSSRVRATKGNRIRQLIVRIGNCFFLIIQFFSCSKENMRLLGFSKVLNSCKTQITNNFNR